MGWIVLTAIAAVILVGAVLAIMVSSTGAGRVYGVGGVIVTILLWVGITALFSFHTVDNGHIGLVKEFGPVVGTTDSGFVTTAPWQDLEEVSVQDELKTYIMDDRREEGTGAAVSSDSQPVFLEVQVRHKLQRDRAVELYRQTGGRHIERLLDPAVFQITKEVTAKYKAIEFARNREDIRQEIERLLSGEVERFGIQVLAVSLKNVDFTDALSQAIEQTVEAEQQAARERAKVEISRAQADQRIADAQGEATANVTRAEGEAKANRLRQRTLTPLLVQQQAIEKLNPNVQLIVCPPRTVCIPNSSTILDSGTP